MENENKGYKGWTNYETWAVIFWIGSDQFLSDCWDEDISRHLEKAPTCQQVMDKIWTAAQAVQFNLADQLKEDIGERLPVEEESIYAMLLEDAFSKVNWHEIAVRMLEAIEPSEESLFGPIVFASDRAQAIADGVLIDVSETGKEAGIKYPVAVTNSVWQKFVVVLEGVNCQDEQGRLWNILWMFRCAIFNARYGDASSVTFSLLVKNDNGEPKTVSLKSICGPGDNAEPVITIMMPDEN